jgi:SOS-response transcriptional repressor LexA
MGWADNYIERLLAGETIQFRPRGNSMSGKIESGQLVTVEPIADHSKLKRGDIVLCKVNGKQFLHLIKSIGERIGFRFLIGNNRGFVNGWTSYDNIYGKVTKVEK